MKNKIHRGNFQANINFLDNNTTLSSHHKILEIGCGLGATIDHYRQQGFDMRGVEINKNYILRSKDLFGPLPIKQVSGPKLPYPDDTFDIVVSFDVFEHIPNTDDHLQEVKRVLKNGGYYLLQTPNKLTNIPFEIIKEKSLTKWKTYHCSLHTSWQLKKRFAKHGFKIRFIDTPIVNQYFKEKIQRYLGKFALHMLRILNPDKFPRFLKTNFYVIASINKNT